MYALPETIPAFISYGYLLTQILNGLVLGMIFALIALGVVLVFGLMGIVNFAHGDLLLLGIFIAISIFAISGSFMAALLLATLVVELIGVGIERLTLRRIYDRGLIEQLLLTYGFAELIRGVVAFVWGREPRTVSSPAWVSGSVDLGFLTYPQYRLFVMAVSGLLILLVYLFIVRTDIGLVIQASMLDREIIEGLGINVRWTYMIVFALGSALAAAAGILIAPMRGVHLETGIELLMGAFVVVVIGGMSSFKGSIITALLIGQVVVLTSIFYPEFSDIIIYVLMGGVLLLRPQGLFGVEGVLD